ncbi:MAG: YggT family protein [Anaerolineaceae bacterium]|nr:YggT family protein [Anaerolineaceae bacterium]
MASFYQIISLVLNIFLFILMARVLLSWIPDVDYSNPLVRLLYDITEPILRPVRNMIPPTSGMDISPIVVFLIVYVLLRLLRF